MIDNSVTLYTITEQQILEARKRKAKNKEKVTEAIRRAIRKYDLVRTPGFRS